MLFRNKIPAKTQGRIPGSNMTAFLPIPIFYGFWFSTAEKGGTNGQEIYVSAANLQIKPAPPQKHQLYIFLCTGSGTFHSWPYGELDKTRTYNVSHQ